MKSALEALLQRTPEADDDGEDSDAGDLEEEGTDALIARPAKVSDGKFCL